MEIRREGSRAKTATVFWSTLVGTAIEQYDFLLYGALAASLFSVLFFPVLDPLAATLAALSTYAVGIFARPIGGLVCGHFGDRIGRKTMLMFSLMLMGVASMLIGLLPTYAVIGIWAPIFLVVLRFMQGVALGGEQAGASLVAVEHAPKERRGLYGSFPTIGSYLGALLSFGALSAAAAYSGPAFSSWGWRIPFVVSIVLLVIGLFVRSSLPETPQFEKLRDSGKPLRRPIFELLRNYPKEIAIATAIRFGNIGWATIILVVTIGYAVTNLGLPRDVILGAVAKAAFVGLFTVPLFGWMSDKIGRRPLIIASGLLMAVFAWPYFTLLQTKDPALVTAAVVFGFAIIVPLAFAIESAFLSELFGTDVRFSGVAIGQQIGGAVSAALLPIFATIALARTVGDPWPIAIFCMAMGIAMALAAIIARETRGISLLSTTAPALAGE